MTTRDARSETAPASAMLLAAMAGWAVFCSTGTAAEPSVAKTARGVAEAWDTLVQHLPELARARKLPEPAYADMTMPKALAGSDLRVQLVTWKRRYTFGRAWVEGEDRTTRAVWIVEAKPAKGGMSLRMTVGVPFEATPNDGECPFDLRFSESGGRISGRYTTPGMDLEPLPISAMTGTLQGVCMPLASRAPGRPKLRRLGTTTAAASLSEARAYLAGAAGMLRLYRTLDIILTQDVAPSDAWDAGRLMVPAFPSEKRLTAAKTAGKAPKVGALDIDLGLDDAMDIVSDTATVSRVARGDDPAAKAKRAAIQGILERMRAAAATWSDALPTIRGAPPGAEESAADPEFGPWYGHGSLATNAAGTNVLPADAEANGMQRWLFVRNWRFVGPFPTDRPDVVSWNLPEFFDGLDAAYVTDREGLKRDADNFVPETPLVFWQQVPEQAEEGLQRAPMWRRAKGKVLTHAGPRSGHAYAKTEIHSPKDVDLWLGIGADDHGRLWVNDRLVAATAGSTDSPERIAWGKASFRKGANVLVVRCDNTRDVRLDGAGDTKRDYERSSVRNHFWAKVAVQGKPLDAVSAKARQEAVAKRRSVIRNLPPKVAGYRNNNTANHPDAKPVTAWDIGTGQNVIWRAHLECEPRGRQYEPRGPNSKAPPVIMGDRIIVLGEPHTVTCLDKATGKVLWVRDCNVLEFTAPERSRPW